MSPSSIALIQDYLPILVMFAFALGFAAVTVMLGRLIGPQKPSSVKLQPYECGIDPVGPANVRLSVKFYLVALLFLLFDVETIFFWLWAVVYTNGSFESAGGLSFQAFAFIEMAVFLGVLLVGYIYVWKKGALDWS